MHVLVRVQMCRIMPDQSHEAGELVLDLACDGPSVVGIDNLVADTPLALFTLPLAEIDVSPNPSPGCPLAADAASAATSERTIRLALVTIPSTCARSTPRLIPGLRPKSSAFTISRRSVIRAPASPPRAGPPRASRAPAAVVATSRATIRATGPPSATCSAPGHRGTPPNRGVSARARKPRNRHAPGVAGLLRTMHRS